MLQTNQLTLQFGKDILFEDVSIKFTKGNCYGIIGANGAGKSTFLKLLSGQIEPSKGSISRAVHTRLSFLEQDHYKFDEYSVLETVIMGNEVLYKIMKEKEEIYAKPDFTEADGIKAGKLEEMFDDMNGWDAESDAAFLLTGLGIETEHHHQKLKTLSGDLKVKVLLAKALFGNPDILLLDEPTNHLDRKAILWLEEYLIKFENTLIIVSHDRYFLNKVCTHIADIDYMQVTLYAGNYDFWYESSQLMLKQAKDQNKKKEEQIKELEEFIARFSANASKSKQATSRKKALDKIELSEIKPSTRRYPYINFKSSKALGDKILEVNDLSLVNHEEVILDQVSFTLSKDDKIAFVAEDEKQLSLLFNCLVDQQRIDDEIVIYGPTVSVGYFEKDHGHIFNSDLTIAQYLQSISPIKEISYVRGFLGRMLFSGDDANKQLSVLSGGEKVRVLMASLMIKEHNMLILDDPTNHLDMESITALNKGLQSFEGPILMFSNDHQLLQTTVNKVAHLKDGKLKIYTSSYDEFMEKELI